MFRLWLEWDFGQENCVFTSPEKARAWLDRAMADDLDSMGFNNTQEVFDEGLASIEQLTVDP